MKTVREILEKLMERGDDFGYDDKDVDQAILSLREVVVPENKHRNKGDILTYAGWYDGFNTCRDIVEGKFK